MAKTYVLDTNVLIQAPYAMQCFEDNHVVIPLVVVEELDGLKKADGERGFNARQAIRFLERLRLRGNLLAGVPLDHGGTLRIEINCVHEALPDSLPDDQADNRILKVCRHLQSSQPILVTKDLVLRLKAQVLHIEAQDFSREQVLPEKNAYTGRLTCYVPEAAFDDFLTQGVAVSQLYLTDSEGRSYAPEVQENEFVILQADASLHKTHLGRVHQGQVLPLTYSRVTPYGIKPRNAGPVFHARSPYAAGFGSPVGHRQRPGRDGKDVLFFGCGPGKNHQPSDWRIPAHSHLPAECAVRLGHRLLAR